MEIGIRLKELMQEKGITAYVFSDETGIPQSTISRLINKGSKPNTSNLKVICDYFNVDRQWFLTGVSDLKEENQYKSEVKQVSFDNFMEVYYLPIEAQAGYLSEYSIDNPNDDLKTILVPKEYEKGNYLVVDVSGDSMDDGTNRAICSGDKLLCKEIEKPQFGNGLSFRQNIFVIMSNEGCVCKQITSHNVDNGLVKCHSWNEKFADYEINLNSVYRLFYVKKIVERRIKL